MSEKPSLRDHRHASMMRMVLDSLTFIDRVWLSDENTIIIDHSTVEFGTGTKTIRTEIKLLTWEVK